VSLWFLSFPTNSFIFYPLYQNKHPEDWGMTADEMRTGHNIYLSKPSSISCEVQLVNSAGCEPIMELCRLQGTV
jgi:hypothetical protein